MNALIEGWAFIFNHCEIWAPKGYTIQLQNTKDIPLSYMNIILDTSTKTLCKYCQGEISKYPRLSDMGMFSP